MESARLADPIVDIVLTEGQGRPHLKAVIEVPEVWRPLLRRHGREVKRTQRESRIFRHGDLAGDTSSGVLD